MNGEEREEKMEPTDRDGEMEECYLFIYSDLQEGGTSHEQEGATTDRQYDSLSQSKKSIMPETL